MYINVYMHIIHSIYVRSVIVAVVIHNKRNSLNPRQILTCSMYLVHNTTLSVYLHCTPPYSALVFAYMGILVYKGGTLGHKSVLSCESEFLYLLEQAF